MSSAKRNLTTLSVSDKIRLIEEIDRGIKRKKVIASEFGIPPNTLSTIYKNRDKIRNKCSASDFVSDGRKRFKPCLYDDIDEAMLKWIKSCRDKNLPVSGTIIREKALNFAKTLGHTEFSASSGWLHRFKIRHHIVQKAICGESAEVNLEDCEDWRKSVLPGLLAEYAPCDIFNADETGLFFKCLPDKTLCFKNEKCHGGKQRKGSQ